MAKTAKRQFPKVKGQVVILDSNTLRKLSFSSATFVKVPVNIGDALRESADKRSWKDFSLYVKFLDLKTQNPNCGTFAIQTGHRYYQRLIKRLITRGWAWKEGRTIKLKAYQEVWRQMGVQRVRVKNIIRYKYWKLPVSMFSQERRIHKGKGKPVQGYLKELETEIRKRIAKRKSGQMRYALKEKDRDTSQTTYSAKSAASCFGYKGTATGSKLRKEYFSVIEDEAKPRFNRARGRYEEPTKRIAL